MKMTVEIHGTCEPGFEPLRRALAANFEDGFEIGASLAATVHGRPMLDIWAGHADVAKTRPWTRDTIVTVNSATKIPLQVMILMLVDRGSLALDAPVADYWPQFAQGGKAAVTIRDVLTHRSGVPGLAPPFADMSPYYDWDGIIARIAAEPHWFGGERRIAYQPVTSGFILGEVMRRVDGRMPRQFFDEEVSARAGGIDLQIGVRDQSELPRVAETGFTRPLEPPAEPSPIAMRIWQSLPLMATAPSWAGRHAQFPAGNAYTNAAALVRTGEPLANAGVLGGRRLFSEALARECFVQQAEGECPMFGHVRLGLTLFLDQPDFPMPSPTAAYWGGNGGALVVMDPAKGFSFAFAQNGMVPSLPYEKETRRLRLWDAMSEILADLPATGMAAS
jgi:CubicO group peptidase (beta-lactamase class C family)